MEEVNGFLGFKGEKGWYVGPKILCEQEFLINLIILLGKFCDVVQLKMFQSIMDGNSIIYYDFWTIFIWTCHFLDSDFVHILFLGKTN